MSRVTGWMATLMMVTGMLAVGSAAAQAPRLVMMASTIGPIDAGIVGTLEAAYARKTGVEVRHAYVLMDRATYLMLKREIALQILVEKDPDLLNDIAVIRVSPARFPRVNAEGAKRFVDWLVSEEAHQDVRGRPVRRAALLPELRRMAAEASVKMSRGSGPEPISSRKGAGA